MNVAAIQREHENNDMCCEDETESLENQAKSLAEAYGVILLANGEISISGKTHTWQEVIDEDLDNILELQRKLHFCYYAKDIKLGAQALTKAQLAVVNDWAIRTARERVGL